MPKQTSLPDSHIVLIHSSLKIDSQCPRVRRFRPDCLIRSCQTRFSFVDIDNYAGICDPSPDFALFIDLHFPVFFLFFFS